MQILRLAFDTARPARPLADPALCLGCPDCAGRCLSLLELDRLPEMVLHPRARRA